jgi:hypothetical protein
VSLWGAAAYDLQPQDEKHVKIVIHVDENLGEHERKDLVAALEGTPGIRAAEFCPLRYHLMLVQYDRGDLSSQEVLARVLSENVHAELIGPM